MSRFGGPEPQGICDRCRLRMRHADMVADPNSPGVRGHQHCMDQFDPYRLPARQAEDITLWYPRPDEPLVVTDNVIGAPTGDVRITENDIDRITEEGDLRIVE